ncbi:MAG: TIGR00730 family Rossman fold protein [Anaerolineales bacterium]|jgi:uncharacterized protein (TIGR00730 family)|nr:TIGR00730 family Rossman fold protein [Anaerolineales bacterium]
MKRICVYCGSSDKLHQDYLAAAYQMGSLLTARNLEIVYGAGSTGSMGALADGALQAGGTVIGVIPDYFNTPALAHQNLTSLEVVGSIHERKARMIELADAFIALPGGFGTFEELFEALTWAQIGLHSKPVGLLNTRHYFDPLLAMVKHAQTEGFIYDEHRALFTCEEKPADLLSAMEKHNHPEGLERWMTREE